MKLSEGVRLLQRARQAASQYEDDPNWSVDQKDHWGGDGSGCLIVLDRPKRRRILLLKRSSYITEPNTWGIPGGARPINAASNRPMPSWTSAVKETREELGGLPPGFRHYAKKVTYRDPKFKFDNYVVPVPPIAREWRPKLDWESVAWGWFSRKETKRLPLHFGIKWLLRQFDPFTAKL